MTRIRVWTLVAAVGIMGGMLCGAWLNREPAWPVPSQYVTEVYDENRYWPDAPRIIVPTFTCRKRDEIHQPFHLSIPKLKPKGKFAIEGDVVYPDWCEGLCLVSVRSENVPGLPKGKITGCVSTGFDRPRHASFRVEGRAPLEPGEYRIWIEYEHPVGNTGSELDLATASGDALMLTTRVAEGEMIVAE